MASDSTPGQWPLELAPTLTLINQLIADRYTRDRQGRFFLEGVRNFVAAVDHGLAIEAIIYSERLLTAPLARKLVRQLKRSGVSALRVSPEQFRSISRTPRAAGVGAIIRQPLTGLPGNISSAPPCWIALSRLRSPGNFGTLIRTAAATGAAGFILLGDQIDPFHPSVVRASMGAIMGQRLVRASMVEFQSWVRTHRLQVVGAAPSGIVLYTQLRYRPPLVLLLGEERAGLTAAEQELCHAIVRIPMAAGTDSLNLGVAGSLLLYEIQRSLAAER